jgi:hypothetical protein
MAPEGISMDEINKIQPIARVTKAGLLLTSMIILSGSLFGQDDKKIEDAEIYGAIGMMFAEGSGLAKMKFTEEQIDLILAGMKKGITLGKCLRSSGSDAQGSTNHDGKDENRPGGRAGRDERTSRGEQSKIKGISHPAGDR